jgi:hypothetical protein
LLLFGVIVCCCSLLHKLSPKNTAQNIVKNVQKVAGSLIYGGNEIQQLAKFGNYVTSLIQKKQMVLFTTDTLGFVYRKRKQKETKELKFPRGLIDY